MKVPCCMGVAVYGNHRCTCQPRTPTLAAMAWAEVEALTRDEQKVISLKLLALLGEKGQ